MGNSRGLLTPMELKWIRCSIRETIKKRQQKKKSALVTRASKECGKRNLVLESFAKALGVVVVFFIDLSFGWRYIDV